MKLFSVPSSLGFLATVFVCSSKSTGAFSFSNLVAKSTQLGSTTAGVDEDGALHIYQKAKEFAFRDDFGILPSSEYDQHYHPLSDEVAEIEEAKHWLEEIVQVYASEGLDLGQNEDEAAEIVTRLRRKIEAHEHRVAAMSKESESIVPTIATELIVGALAAVLFTFWTTLDLGQRHDDIGAVANYNEWLNILQEKGYLLSLFQGAGPTV